ncbi:MAG: hypothetical protein AAF206_03440 [Bacteroidota bacterium]
MSDLEEAYKFLAEHEYEAARNIAQKLISEDDADGFLLKTDIHHQLEEWKEALHTLETAVEQFPKNWIFWMRLGNYQSDFDAFEDATYSLERALYLSGADVPLIKMNKATLALRMHDYASLQRLLPEVQESYPFGALQIELAALVEQEAYVEAVNRFEEAFPDQYAEEESLVVAEIFYLVALACHMMEDEKHAGDFLQAALLEDRSNQRALWLRRKMYGKIHAENRYFQIMISGIWPEGKGVGFFTNYHVVAQDEAAAFAIIKAFEPNELNVETFKVEEIEELDIESGLDYPDGIYRTGEFFTYQPE